MADDDTLYHLVALPNYGTGLTDHLPDGGGGGFKIVTGTGQDPGQPVVGVFQIGKIYIHLALQCPEGFRLFVAAAVVNDRDRQLRLQSRENGREVLGGGHQVDVLGALGDEVLHHLPQRGGIRGFAHGTAGNGVILAVFTAQGASAEENCAASAFPCQGRLFPFVDHGLGYHGCGRTAAIAGLVCFAVNITLSRTQIAVYIIHKSFHL